MSSSSSTYIRNYLNLCHQVDVHKSRMVLRSKSPLFAKFLCSSHWIVDSTASKHLCKDRRLMKSMDYRRTGYIFKNGKAIKYRGVGVIELNIAAGDATFPIKFSEVHYCPSLEINIFSVSKLNEIGFKVTFVDEKCYFQQGEAAAIQAGVLIDNLYRVLVIQHCYRLSESSNCIH